MTRKSDKLAKASLARISSVTSGKTTTDARVSPLSQSLGVTYDVNNHVTHNQTTDRITTLESQVSTLQTDLATANSNIATLQSQVTALLTHTHNYTDNSVSMVTGVPN